MSSNVSPTYVKRFNEASQTANTGDIDKALELYNGIFDPIEDSSEKAECSKEFLAVVEMRKAYLYMDTGDYFNAQDCFESPNLVKNLGELDGQTLYYYYFSYANTLGNLKITYKMSEIIDLAFKIALDNEDFEGAQNSLINKLYWFKYAQDWNVLLEVAHNIHELGVNSDNYLVQTRAGEYACYANRGLGRMDEAKRGAQKMIERYEEAGLEDKVLEWKEFLNTLN